MARRASSSPQLVWVIVTVALLIGAAGGGYFLFERVSDPYRTLSTLPVQDYLENANSLRGNVYKLDATVAKSLDWSAKTGRLFSVESPEGEVLGVVVPPELSRVNMERGQHFVFKIEVADKGILRVQEVKKV